MTERKTYNKPLLAGTSAYAPDDTTWINRTQGMDAWEIHMTVEGMGEAKIGEKEIEVEVGDLLLYPAGIPHNYRTLKNIPWTKLWVYFFPQHQWDELLSWPELEKDVMKLHIPEGEFRDQIEDEFREMVTISRLPIPRCNQLTQNILEKVLLLCDQHNPMGDHIQIDLRIQRVLNHIPQHFAENLNVETLAALTHLSPSRFAVLFKKEVGATPMAYLEKYRVSQAAEMLLWRSAPIYEVAEKVGFHCPFYFSRVFRKHYGASPREFRQRN